MKTKGCLVVIGLGFVGQANALAFIQKGYDAIGVDIKEVENLYDVVDFSKVKFFTYDKLRKFLSLTPSRKLDADVIVCVNAKTLDTPPFQELGSVHAALYEARNICTGTVTLRSTILPKLLSELDFDYYVPEFLHEKNAINECLDPEVLVLGVSKKIKTNADELPLFLQEIFKDTKRMFIGSPEEASFVKYISNTYNSLRITYVNQIGDFMKSEGITPEKIIEFIFPEKSYLRYGKAYDGNCLPKDIEAFSREYASSLLCEVIKTNSAHAERDQNLRKIFHSEK